MGHRDEQFVSPRVYLTCIALVAVAFLLALSNRWNTPAFFLTFRNETHEFIHQSLGDLQTAVSFCRQISCRVESTSSYRVHPFKNRSFLSKSSTRLLNVDDARSGHHWTVADDCPDALGPRCGIGRVQEDVWRNDTRGRFYDTLEQRTKVRLHVRQRLRSNVTVGLVLTSQYSFRI
ncbi:hypothetical protein C8R48DRAFT_760357 [Suillus tomentosus]|nr:hypothetical protein C8R48DRAFT_760357 [Suillus tomentosus]